MTGNQGLDSWRGQMERWTKRPMVARLSIQDWIRKKNKRKKEKKKGAMCGFLCFIQGRQGLGAMREFEETSPHGWEKDPGSYYLGRIWELEIQHCPTER